MVLDGICGNHHILIIVICLFTYNFLGCLYYTLVFSSISILKTVNHFLLINWSKLTGDCLEELERSPCGNLVSAYLPKSDNMEIDSLSFSFSYYIFVD